MRWITAYLLWMLVAATASAAGDRPTTETMRIVSGAPNITEMIFALGAGGQVVGGSTFTEYPPEALHLPPVIDLFNPNLEALLQLAPDVVFLLQGHEKARTFLATRPGVEVMTLPEIETLAQIDAAMIAIGDRLGRGAAARALVEQWRAPFAEASASDAPRPRVLFVVGYGAGLSQLYAVGRGTYLNELIEAAGGDNVVAEGLGRYPVLDKEALVRLDPQVILRAAQPGKGAELLRAMEREWRALPTISAVRQGRFRVVEEKGLLIPGPRARSYLPAMRRAINE